jgi:hypothetical protein
MLRGLFLGYQEGSEEGSLAIHRVGLSLRGMGSGSPHPILSTHSEYSLPDFPYETHPDIGGPVGPPIPIICTGGDDG